MTSDPLVARLTADRSGPPAHVIDRVRAAAVDEGLVDVAWTTTDSASTLKKRRAAARVSAKPNPSAPRAW